MAELKWYQRYSEAIVTGLIVCVVWLGFAYLAHVASSWMRPIIFASCAAFVVFLACMAVLLLRRVPRRPVIPTGKNIESCVRVWLDNYKIAVKNDPCLEAYFRFQITLDGGQHITVARWKHEYSDYVQLFCDLGIRGDDRNLLVQFSTNELAQILLDIKVELARAQIGYGGLVDPPEKFHLFRRIPIHPNLTEFAFMGMLGGMESAMNLVFLAFMRARLQLDQKAIEDGSPTQR